MYGIIGAMASEVEILLAHTEDKEISTYAGSQFCKGKLCGKDVVIAMCGIGKVCAAICVQIMSDIYKVDKIINTGVAGGLHHDLEVGDFVIADTLVEYDFDLTAFGYAKGYMPCEELLTPSPDKSTPTVFTADKKIVESFMNAQRRLGKGKAIVGRIVSGDIFVSDNALKKELIGRFDASAVEMEGAAIAQACSLSGIPFAVIRAISDLADKEASISFNEFEIAAAKLSSEILMKMLEE